MWHHRLEGKVGTMRRTAAVLVSMVLAGALSSGAARGESFDDEPRTSTAAYLATGGPSGAPSVYWPDSPAGNLGGVDLRVREGEHFVSVSVRDDSGVRVHGEIAADLDGALSRNRWAERCSQRLLARFSGGKPRRRRSPR